MKYRIKTSKMEAKSFGQLIKIEKLSHSEIVTIMSYDFSYGMVDYWFLLRMNCPFYELQSNPRIYGSGLDSR